MDALAAFSANVVIEPRAIWLGGVPTFIRDLVTGDLVRHVELNEKYVLYKKHTDVYTQLLEPCAPVVFGDDVHDRRCRCSRR